MRQAAEEEYRYIFQACRDEFRKAKPQLELKVVRNVREKVMVRKLELYLFSLKVMTLMYTMWMAESHKLQKNYN